MTSDKIKLMDNKQYIIKYIMQLLLFIKINIFKSTIILVDVKIILYGKGRNKKSSLCKMRPIRRKSPKTKSELDFIF